MKPEELLDPDKFPDDLQWVVTHFHLRPDDPVFLLIAWHWNRMNACEDRIRASLVELKAAVDSRINTLADAADTVAGISDALLGVQAALEDKPAELAGKFDAELQQPIARALGQLQTLEKTLAPVARGFQVAQRRQLLATLLVGVALGFLSATIHFLR